MAHQGLRRRPGELDARQSPLDLAGGLADLVDQARDIGAAHIVAVQQRVPGAIAHPGDSRIVQCPGERSLGRDQHLAEHLGRVEPIIALGIDRPPDTGHPDGQVQIDCAGSGVQPVDIVHQQGQLVGGCLGDQYIDRAAAVPWRGPGACHQPNLLLEARHEGQPGPGHFFFRPIGKHHTQLLGRRVAHRAPGRQRDPGGRQVGRQLVGLLVVSPGDRGRSGAAIGIDHRERWQ